MGTRKTEESVAASLDRITTRGHTFLSPSRDSTRTRDRGRRTRDWGVQRTGYDVNKPSYGGAAEMF